MVPILEAVPNFSEGRDLGWIGELLQVIERESVEVLDWTADREHHRSVVTYIGDLESVEAASIAAALFAMDGIDLRTHQGLHPRIGALDVLPFVPLHDLTMDLAIESARRVAGRLAEEGIPVYSTEKRVTVRQRRDPTARSHRYDAVGSKRSRRGSQRAGSRTWPLLSGWANHIPLLVLLASVRAASCWRGTSLWRGYLSTLSRRSPESSASPEVGSSTCGRWRWSFPRVAGSRSP